MNSFMGVRDISRFSEKTEVGATPLMIAARDEDLQQCLQLVAEGQDPRATTPFGVSLFHLAAVNKHHGLDIILHFVNQGLDLAEDVDGEEPVHYALRVGDWMLAENLLQLQYGEANLLLFFVSRNQLEMAQAAHEKDCRLIGETDAIGRNALHLAAEFADLEMCQWIVSQGVSTESLSGNGSTPLHYAVLNAKHGQRLVPFFGGKRNLHAKNESGETALHVALKAGNSEIVQVLLGLGVKIQKCDENMLFYFVKRNDFPAARLVHEIDQSLMTELDVFGQNALHMAARHASQQMCHWLFTNGLNPALLVHKRKYYSVLHLAALNHSHGAPLVRFFVELGLDLNCKGNAPYSPLYLALKQQNLGVASEMIVHGADLTEKSGEFNLFHRCVIANCLKSAEFLLSRDPTLVFELTRSTGLNALHLASIRADRHMCQFLCDIGFDPQTLGKFKFGVLHGAVLNKKFGPSLVKYFVNEKAVDLLQKNVAHWTPLHTALLKEDLAVAEAMLECGVDLAAKLASENLLHFCAYHNKMRSAKFLLEKLICTVGEVDFRGKTALHVAAKMGHYEFCRFLVEEGIDVNAYDLFRHKALFYVPFIAPRLFYYLINLERN